MNIRKGVQILSVTSFLAVGGHDLIKKSASDILSNFDFSTQTKSQISEILSTNEAQAYLSEPYFNDIYNSTLKHYKNRELFVKNLKRFKSVRVFDANIFEYMKISEFFIEKSDDDCLNLLISKTLPGIFEDYYTQEQFVQLMYNKKLSLPKSYTTFIDKLMPIFLKDEKSFTQGLIATQKDHELYYSLVEKGEHISFTDPKNYAIAIGTSAGKFRAQTTLAKRGINIQYNNRKYSTESDMLNFPGIVELSTAIKGAQNNKDLRFFIYSLANETNLYGLEKYEGVNRAKHLINVLFQIGIDRNHSTEGSDRKKMLTDLQMRYWDMFFRYYNDFSSLNLSNPEKEFVNLISASKGQNIIQSKLIEMAKNLEFTNDRHFIKAYISLKDTPYAQVKMLDKLGRKIKFSKRSKEKIAEFSLRIPPHLSDMGFIRSILEGNYQPRESV